MPMTPDQMALARQKISDKGTSCSQSVQLENAVGGSWTISFSGQTTSAIPFNAGSNVLQNALSALSNIGLGNITVNDTANGGVPNSAFYAVYFAGTLSNVAQPMLTANIGGLTGTGVLALIAQVTAGGVTAFTDAELNANYDLALGNFNLGLYYDIIDLQFNASRFNDYVAGQSSEKKSQIPANLEKMAEYYKVLSNADRQVQPVRLIGVPPRLRAVPITTGVPALSLQYGPTRRGPFGNRGGWGDWE